MRRERPVRCTEVMVVNGHLIQAWIGDSQRKINDAINAAVLERLEILRQHPTGTSGGGSAESGAKS